MSETTPNVVDSAVAQEAFLADVPANTSTLTTPVTNSNFVEQKSYTDEDLKRVREQEKSKLYPQIDSLKEELALIKKREEERLAEAEKVRLESEAEAKKKAEAEMDLRQLLETKEKGLNRVLQDFVSVALVSWNRRSLRCRMPVKK